MAETALNVTPGQGIGVATDVISSLYHQVVKIKVGAEGEGAYLDTGQQDKDHSLPVTLASDQGALAVADGGGSLTVDGVVSLPGGAMDAGPAWASVFGVSGAAVVSANMTSATPVTDAPTSGQKLVIVDVVVSTDTAMNVLFEEETSGTDIFLVYIPANGVVQITPRGKIKLATANKKLTAKASVAGNIAVTITYYSEA